MSCKSKKPVLWLDDGTTKELPSKWCICDVCEGHGGSSAYLGAFTQDEMDECGDEFLEDYVAGAYDRACESCGGTGKVLEPDFDQISEADSKAYRDQLDADWYDRQEQINEARWGA